MLLGQYLCGGHQACLIAVVESNEHRHECNECLARAHIALQESVHLPSRAHVGPDFVHDTFLCTSEFEGQILVIERVKDIANCREDVATILATLVAGIAQNVELHIEQFLELQSDTCALHLVGRLWVMDPAQGLIA